MRIQKKIEIYGAHYIHYTTLYCICPRDIVKNVSIASINFHGQ